MTTAAACVGAYYVYQNRDKIFKTEEIINEDGTVTKKRSYVDLDNIKEKTNEAVNKTKETAQNTWKKAQEKLAKLNASYKVNIKDGATNVPSGDFTLIIKFSKPMREGIALHFSSTGVDFPTFKGYKWSDDKTLKVNFYLEPSHKYGFTVFGESFYTKDGHTAGKSQEINFTTSD